MRSSKSGSPTSASIPSSRDSLRAWVLAARPKTLTASVVPVLVGTAVAVAAGITVNPALSSIALIAALCLQVGTNLINDAIDHERGADTESRLGPTRVVQSGLLEGTEVRLAGAVALAFAALFCLPLVAAGGWPIAVLAVVSLVCGWAYTGGPFPLAYHGLGDLFVLLFFGLAAVCGTAYLQAGRVDTAFIVAGFQVGLLATVLIAVNNLRDIAGDSAVGKRTVAVRLGKRGARAEIALLVVIPFVLGAYWAASGNWWAAALPFLSAPLALRVLLAIYRTEPSRDYNRYLALAAALHLAFGILLTWGLFTG